MGDRDERKELDQPSPDDVTSSIDEEPPRAREAAKASAKLRDEDDPDNASSETS
jgi:hypothetical protein